MNTVTVERKNFLCGIATLTFTVLLYLLVVLSKAPDLALAYLLTIAPAVLGCIAMLTMTSKSNDPVSTAVCLLFGCMLINANAYQTVSDGEGYMKTAALNFAGILCAVCSLVLYTKILKKKLLVNTEGYKLAIIITGAASLMLCLVLLLWGTEINHARLWISFGNYTIQLSEVIKFLVFVQFALIYNSNMTAKEKMLACTVCLGINSFFMVLFYELGTVIVYVTVYLIAFFVHLRSRYALLVVGGFLVLTVGALGLVYGLHTKTEGATDIFSSLINKIYSRLSMSDTYQTDQALMSILNGGIFGSDMTYIVEFFSMKNDFALANLAQYFGIPNMLLFILANGAVVYVVYLRGQNEEINNRSRYKVSFIFSSAIAVQTLLSLCSICGYVCGVGTPGLSAGGTQTIIYYIMAGFIVYGFMEDNALKPIRITSAAQRERSRFYNEYEV